MNIDTELFQIEDTTLESIYTWFVSLNDHVFKVSFRGITQEINCLSLLIM